MSFKGHGAISAVNKKVSTQARKSKLVTNEFSCSKPFYFNAF